MKQSSKDAATKAAWITGGFALAGTLITLLFTSGAAPKDLQPSTATTSISASGGPASPPTITATPTVTVTSTATVTSIATVTSTVTVTATPPPPLVPPEVVGRWAGGEAGKANFRLVITESADYLFWDVDVPSSPVSGKVAVKEAILEFHGDDGTVNRAPWSVEKTPRGDELHLGVTHYLRY